MSAAIPRVSSAAGADAGLVYANSSVVEDRSKRIDLQAARAPPISAPCEAATTIDHVLRQDGEAE